MNPRSRGTVSGLVGFFAGFFGAQVLGEELGWGTWTKTGAAGAISFGVILLLMFLLRPRNSKAHATNT